MKKNFLKIFIFIMIIFLTPKVFAQDFTVSNTNITSPQGGGRTGTYTGTEIYETGSSNVYNMNTRYNGKLSRIIFNLSPGGYAETTSNFDLGKTYTLTLNMATDDWRNNFGSVSVKCNGSTGTELSNGRVNYINYRKINFSFSTGSNTCGFVYVDLKSKSISSTAFTGVSNWNLSSMVITDPTYCSGSDCYSPPSGGSSGSTNQDIINANNQNTQDIINNDDKNTNNIINNNTNNTNNIIENNNQNTEVLNDSLNSVCKSGPYNITTELFADKSLNGKELKSDGSIGNWSSAYITKYLYLKSNTDYTIIFPGGSVGNVYYCLYTSNNSLSSCVAYNNRTEITFNTGQYIQSIRLTVPNYRNMVIKGPICNDFSVEAQNDTTNAINNVNDSINNSNVENGTGQGFFDDFTSQDFGLSQIITIPLNTIQSLTSKSCVPLQVPIPFTNSNINLPCMTEIYETKFPSIYNLWKIVSFGIIAYLIAIDIFHIVKGFKDPESDKVEVLDL